MTPDAERSRALYERHLFPECAERVEALGERDREAYWLRLYESLGGPNDRMARTIFGRVWHER